MADGSIDGVPSLGEYGAHAAPGVHDTGQTPQPPEAARQRNGRVLPGPTSMAQREQGTQNKSKERRKDTDTGGRNNTYAVLDGPKHKGTTVPAAMHDIVVVE